MSKEPKRNVYVGHRYVPKVMGEWDKAETYEGLSIVTNKGTSYTSKKRVPKGIDILNEEYWVVTGNYNAQIEEYRGDVSRIKKDMTNLETDLTKDMTDLEEDVNNQLKYKVNKKNLPINTKEYNVIGDGMTDESINFQRAVDDATLQKRTLYVPDGEYKMNNIELTCDMEISNRVIFKYNGEKGGILLDIVGDDLYINKYKSDGENQDVTLLKISGSFNKIDNIENSNITINEDTPKQVWGVQIRGNNNEIDNIKCKNFYNNGYINESFPQAVLSSGDKNKINLIDFENIESGLVTQYDTTTYFGTLNIKNARDNGVYQLKDSNILGDYIKYIGSEEPIVFKGNNGYIDSIYVEGYGSVIGFENCGDIRINSIYIKKDKENKSVISLFRTRRDNISSGKISIGTVNGEIFPHQLILFNEGTIEYFSIEKLNLEYIYNEKQSPIISQWCNLEACKGLNIKDFYVNIIDEEDILTTKDNFVMLLSKNIEYESFIDGIYINIYKSDKKTLSSGLFRGANFLHEKIFTNNLIWDTRPNINNYIRNNNFGEKNTATNKPIIGDWHVGTILYNNNPKSGDDIGWIYTNDKTWNSIGSV